MLKSSLISFLQALKFVKPCIHSISPHVQFLQCARPWEHKNEAHSLGEGGQTLK